MKKEITFEILKEKISPENVLDMAELIALSETKFLIGYMGERMQKLHNDLYVDIMHKHDVNHTINGVLYCLNSYNILKSPDFIFITLISYVSLYKTL